MKGIQSLFCVILSIISTHSLASSNITPAEEFIAKHGYSKAIAQLFVIGIPADYKNISSNSQFDELMSLGIGGVMLNHYNIPSQELKKDDRDLATNNIVSFIYSIKNKSKKNGQSALIFADFESFEYSSVKYPLSLPPNPLVLASTGDTRYSYYAGRASAYQLKGIGVDAIFGPVLDLDHCSQGVANKSIAMRSYSESRRIMTPHAQAYLQGVNDGHLIAFTKHFPSYSHVDSNAHSAPTIYHGSIEVINDELQSFADLKDFYRGIMTSHLSVKAEDEFTTITYNPEFIKKYIHGRNLSDKILITDDISNMIAAKKYIEALYGSFSYSNAALHAFKAGHDLILFSHFSNSNKNSGVKIDDIKSSVSLIEKLILNDAEFRRKFITSLNKILSLKSFAAQGKSFYEFNYEAEDVFKDEATEFRTYEAYKQAVYDNAHTIVSNGKNAQVMSYLKDISKKKVIIAPQSVINAYQEKLNGEFLFHSHPISNSYENTSLFKKEQQDILNTLKKYDVAVIYAENIDHVNLIDYIRLKSPELLDKVVVFLHASPHFIKMELFNSVLIYANISKDPISYLTDVKSIRGELQAKDLSWLPISLGNKSIHNAMNTQEPKIMSANKNPIKVFNTSYERELYSENQRLKKNHVDSENELKKLNTKLLALKNINNNYITLLIPILILLPLLIIIFEYRYKKTTILIGVSTTKIILYTSTCIIIYLSAVRPNWVLIDLIKMAPWVKDYVIFFDNVSKAF